MGYDTDGRQVCRALKHADKFEAMGVLSFPFLKVDMYALSSNGDLSTAASSLVHIQKPGNHGMHRWCQQRCSYGIYTGELSRRMSCEYTAYTCYLGCLAMNGTSHKASNKAVAQ